MAKPPLRNVGASVRQRLLNLSRTDGVAFDILLTRYVLERLLYRLTLTPHGERFVLKGAMLLTTWLADAFRQTRDIDLLGFGSSAPDVMLAVFKEVCAVTLDDGVEIDVDGLRVDAIREALEYGGLRLLTTAAVAAARVHAVLPRQYGLRTEGSVHDRQGLRR
jgi:predicted nucleotidyltransferase component of viral defense system